VEDSSRRLRLPRRAIVAASVVAAVAALGAGFAWAASGTAERPGERIAVEPVTDDDPLVATTPPSPTPSPSPSPSETPRPVPAPPPVDVDDDLDDDDDDLDDDLDDDD
jgi:outer membrane biosynthesis protein TonB